MIVMKKNSDLRKIRRRLDLLVRKCLNQTKGKSSNNTSNLKQRERD
jgi:hypothetical protein